MTASSLYHKCVGSSTPIEPGQVLYMSFSPYLYLIITRFRSLSSTDSLRLWPLSYLRVPAPAQEVVLLPVARPDVPAPAWDVVLLPVLG